MKSFVVFLVLIVQIFGQVKIRYDNYQVYRVTPIDSTQVQFLHQLEYQDASLNFWTSVKGIGRQVDVMVPPSNLNEFEDLLTARGISWKIMVPDVQKLIDNEQVNKDGPNADFGWTDYHTLEEINAWLEELAKNYSDHVSLVNGGTTYEGRTILGVQVNFASGNENDNKSIFIESNIHAREWISSASVTYFLNELLTSTDTNIREIAENYNWYIFPVVNPDGFAYTHSTDRMWRKTRIPHSDTCIGADPNRNWGYHFNEGGTSPDPCNNIYAGPEAFSENSTRTLSEFITTIGPSLHAYITFHSYSQDLMTPYGYTNEHLDNYDELYEVGLKAADSLSKRYGTKYTVGNMVDVMYVASGNSLDWVKGTFGTRITYTYELRDTGEYGFVLPPAQILPTAEETLDSLVTIIQEFEKLPERT